jgi:hypothetical protein
LFKAFILTLAYNLRVFIQEGLDCIEKSGSFRVCRFPPSCRHRSSNSPTQSPTNYPTSLVVASNSPTQSPTFYDGSVHVYCQCIESRVLSVLSPSANPSKSPTPQLSASPTLSPSMTPTLSPTASPTLSPTNSLLTVSPSQSLTPSPSLSPTWSPTQSPSRSPTQSPTLSPSSSPTRSPTQTPTLSPTRKPTVTPTLSPSRSPTQTPTLSPSRSPTQTPTLSPSLSPTQTPTLSPTRSPFRSPTLSPTRSPSRSPTKSPTRSPTQSPTIQVCTVSMYVFEDANGDGVWNNEEMRYANISYTLKLNATQKIPVKSSVWNSVVVPSGLVSASFDISTIPPKKKDNCTPASILNYECSSSKNPVFAFPCRPIVPLSPCINRVIPEGGRIRVDYLPSSSNCSLKAVNVITGAVFDTTTTKATAFLTVPTATYNVSVVCCNNNGCSGVCSVEEVTTGPTEPSAGPLARSTYLFNIERCVHSYGPLVWSSVLSETARSVTSTCSSAAARQTGFQCSIKFSCYPL